MITPYPQARVTEGQDMTMSCSWIASDVVRGVIWHDNGFSLGTISISQSRPCDIYGKLLNYNEFDVGCDCNNTFSVTIKKVHRSRNNAQWSCEMLIGGRYISSESTTIAVEVGLSEVVLLPLLPQKIIADKEATLKCRTSGGLPPAKVTWFMDSGEGFTNMSTQSFNSYAEVDDVFVVTSKMSFTPSRNNTYIKVFCSVSNVGSEFRSRTAVVEVLSFPLKPVISINGKPASANTHIVEGQSTTLHCESQSHPPSTYTWIFPGGTTIGQDLLLNNPATHTIRQHEGCFVCIADNALNGISTMTFLLNASRSAVCFTFELSPL
ncbi:cell adhesion molecule 2-like isoform X2 [Dreissena polymorpha]|uniref:cell adhesion molecule 2-like isoform X2 n=1 Tax=Dreissena polymorpha TaxID=45954 RepID=UPI0022644586|nr:cell adhesion molecule 2-like isoform X2 [Dreissena polymorpha]